MGRYYIDCEFDGHNGPLLSMAVVPEVGKSLHFETGSHARDPWVIENVQPIMHLHHADTRVCLPVNDLGHALRYAIGNDPQPHIVADSPVDIARFCQAISTGEDGSWASTNYERMTFTVENVDCYPTDLPGAVQHNAWWDAMALRHKLTALPA